MIKDVVETSPSFVFLALWQSGIGIELAGWISSAFVAAVLFSFVIRRIAPDPILLGINFHLLVITPAIVGLFALGYREFAQSALEYAHPSVFVSILAVGAVFLASGKSLLRSSADRTSEIRSSLALLAAASLGGLWAFTYSGPPLLQIAVPIMVVFGMRRFLIARDMDRSGPLSVAAATSVTAEPMFDPAS
ncbi:hypothetical protein GTW25_13055 [Aliihoeflea aestuarii]|jgi:hypothetical protein|uniref:hypothetical protein n=1 Tax=Aliihoeflea aestuarii TaxID=453840 RepID=UPI002092A681|nr:hypothetical protein [Aliihoeflea aestuarii]MCO6391959.1 hypothetical protein [Aliihoeflea aestuarii]